MREQAEDGARAAWLAVAGLAVIPLLVPLFEGRVTLGPLPVDAVILSVIVALAASAAYLRSCGVLMLPATSILHPAAVFLAIAAIGVAVHGSPNTLMTWFRYACYFALVPVAGLITQDPARRRILLWAVVAGGSVTLLHATYQYLNPGATQAIGMKELIDSGVGARVYSTFENPNFFAEYLVLLFAVGLALVLSEKRLLRVLAVGVTGYSGAILLLTYTRGSWLALALGVTITVMLVNWRLLLPLVAAVGVGVLALPGVTSRLMSIGSTEGTVSFRMRLWRIAGEVITDHPFLGVGLGDFYRGFQEVVFTQPGLGVGFTRYGAHNSYFQVTAETGLLGGLAFVAAILYLCRAGFAYSLARYPSERERLQASALFAGLIAFAINALTSNVLQHPRGAVFFFLIAGISVGIGMQAIGAAVLPTVPRDNPGVFSRSLTAGLLHHVLQVIAASRVWSGLTSLPEKSQVLVNSRFFTRLLGSSAGQRELQGSL